MASNPKVPAAEERLSAIESALGALANSLMPLGRDVQLTVRNNDLLRTLVKARREQIADDEAALVAEQRQQRVADRAAKEAKKL